MVSEDGMDEEEEGCEMRRLTYIFQHVIRLDTIRADFVSEPSGFKTLTAEAPEIGDDLLQRTRKLHTTSIYAAEAHYDLTEAMSALSEEAMVKANQPLGPTKFPWTTIVIFLFGMSLIWIMPSLVPVLAAIRLVSRREERERERERERLRRTEKR